MSYLLDRRRAFRHTELVVITNIRLRGMRSRLVLRDGSLQQTRTRPKTLTHRRLGTAAMLRGLPALWQGGSFKG